MDNILGHGNNDAFVVSRLGHKIWCCTTKGWFIYVRWEYSSDSWVALKYLKYSNPVELYEHTAVKKLLPEPTFFLVGPLLS